MALIHPPHSPSGAGGRRQRSSLTPPSCQPQAKGSSSPCPRYLGTSAPPGEPHTVSVLGFLCFAMNQQIRLDGAGRTLDPPDSALGKGF